MNACASEFRPVLLERNWTIWGAVERVPEATTDMRSAPFTCSVRPAPPTAWATQIASSSQRQVVDAVGASVGHGVARVVPSVPAVGSQPRTIWNVAAAVFAI